MGLIEAAGDTAALSEPIRTSIIGHVAVRVAAILGARESHSRSIAKALSWRATGSIDTFVISWIITGNTTIAGSIAITEIVTKIGLYYLHERAWTLIPWGRR